MTTVSETSQSESYDRYNVISKNFDNKHYNEFLDNYPTDVDDEMLKLKVEYANDVDDEMLKLKVEHIEKLREIHTKHVYFLIEIMEYMRNPNLTELKFKRAQNAANAIATKTLKIKNLVEEIFIECIG